MILLSNIKYAKYVSNKFINLFTNTTLTSLCDGLLNLENRHEVVGGMTWNRKLLKTTEKYRKQSKALQKLINVLSG